MRIAPRPLLLAAALAAAGVPALAQVQAETPLSAIDWLSDTIARPAGLPIPPAQRTGPHSGDVADSAAPQAVTVAPLDAPPPDALGLYPAPEAGLPESLWSEGSVGEIARTDPTSMTHALPAVRQLFRAMLEAQSEPPPGRGPAGELFLARVDALLAMGAIGPASKLLDMAGGDEPEHFRRAFDIALLSGTENAACQQMRQAQGITPTYAARIFCLARGGDWPAAALTLETAQALDVVDTADEARLARFLDDHGEAELALPPPRKPTPLDFAIYEAIGEPLRAASLPIAFSHAELRPMIGWKARIEAAERLVAAGAIPPRRLWRIYAERAPAASGALWDRVAAVQALERAIGADDPEAVTDTLPPAWDALRRVGLDYALARHHGASLSRMDLGGRAGAIALEAGLLSKARERVAQTDPPDADARTAFLLALARGRPDEAEPPDDLAGAIRDGFSAAPPEAVAQALEAERADRALLAAIALMREGDAGDLGSLVDGLAALRAAGQERRAVEAALQLMILDRRG